MIPRTPETPASYFEKWNLKPSGVPSGDLEKAEFLYRNAKAKKSMGWVTVRIALFSAAAIIPIIWAIPAIKSDPQNAFAIKYVTGGTALIFILMALGSYQRYFLRWILASNDYVFWMIKIRFEGKSFPQ